MTDAMTTWYIMLHGFEGDSGEFMGGEYLCKIIVPAEFPRDPPEFYMMTPNGVYECDGKVCIGIGEFHKNAYPATFGITGFSESLVSGMIGWKTIGSGIRLLDTSEEAKKRLAADSQVYNATYYVEVLKLFQ